MMIAKGNSSIMKMQQQMYVAISLKMNQLEICHLYHFQHEHQGIEIIGFSFKNMTPCHLQTAETIFIVLEIN